MRKISYIALLLSPLVNLGAAIVEATQMFSRLYAAPPPPPTLNMSIPLRRDLLQGQMPEQPRPTQRNVRSRHDQRPTLRLFTLPRADFSF